MADNEKIEIPTKFKELVEGIEKLTVLELADLVKALEEKFGVSAQLPVMQAPAPVAAETTADKEEKSAFSVKLMEVGSQKIEVIKVVRDATGKGLKEAKDGVDATAAGPQVVAENLKKEDAEALKKKFETAGAKAELQ